MAKPELKIPPQDLEAEQSVLGSLMIDKEAIANVADLLTPGDFYKKAHAQIYEAILALWEKNEPVDILSVTGKLKQMKQLKEVGGSSYLTELAGSVPTASHVTHYAKLVKEKHILRELINASAEITESAFETSDDMEEMLDSIEQRIFSISQQSISKNFVSVRENLKDALERIEKLHEGEGSRLRGVPTGFTKLDSMLSGLQKSDMIIVGARPSFGKTSFALDIARHAAVKNSIPVGIFSLEMSQEQVTDRFISAEAQVDLWRLRTGRLNLNDDIEFQMIQTAVDRLSRAPLFIDDTPSPNIIQIRSMARRLQAEQKGLGLIIIDYLQLIQPRHSRDNAVQQVTEISRGLKALARELNTPVLAVSQLSRGVEQRETKIPRLSDLRESGCLTAESLIMRADTGELMTIKSLADRKVQSPIPVYTLDENWKLVVRPLVKAFSSGQKKVYEMKLKSGRIIRASSNHPFRTLKDWQPLETLKVGDRLALPRSVRVTKPENPLTDNELVLLAHLLGDGCTVPKQPIHYTSADWENITAVAEISKQMFGIKPRIIQQKNWWHVYLPSPYHLTHNKPHPITVWLRKLGLDLYRSYEKQISPLVFRCGNDRIAFFLRHLWATDGNISWKKLVGRKPAGAIYYGSTSRALAGQVQHLLLRLDIQSTLVKVPQGIHRPMYNVQIYGKENQLRFLKTVGCFGKRGEVVPKMITALEEVTANTNTDTVPKEVWQLIIEPAKVAVGLSWRDVSAGMSVSYNGSTLFRNGISRERLPRLRFLKNPMIEKLATSDVYWDEIISIKEQGVEEVYDATVQDTHNFIANDIIVHNSIEQDADVVLFLHPRDRDKPEVSPEEEGIVDIIIAKHRNGPIGTVRLKFDKEKVCFQNIETRYDDDSGTD